MARYKNFFGIQSDEQLKREADELKKGGDFTSPDNFEVHHDSVRESELINVHFIVCASRCKASPWAFKVVNINLLLASLG